MEIKINKEIMKYHETIFLGLSFRQFICSLASVLTAMGVYFLLKNSLGKETTSWVCIICASPFAFAGFFSYNTMSFEKFLLCFIKTNFIYNGCRVYKSENYLEFKNQSVKKERKVDVEFIKKK